MELCVMKYCQDHEFNKVHSWLVYFCREQGYTNEF